MAVDIGAEAIDRSAAVTSERTVINKDGQASESGTITSIDIRAFLDITGLRVGTFYVTNGNTLKCRDSEAIAGTITAGSKVNKEVSLAVEIGDYIGCYYTDGALEVDLEGFAGYWWIDGEYIDPNDEVEYNFAADSASSLGGYITPPPPGLENKSANMGSKMVAAGVL